MAKSYFITGTDTGIGKTTASITLLQIAKKKEKIVVGYKPVASGAKITSFGLRSNDGLALQQNSSLKLPYVLINPYTFAEPTSPHIISADEKKPILFSQLTKGLRKLESLAEYVLVEGAGGWFTPLTQHLTFADWVIQERLPIILVVGIKIGCINHAMLTAKAIIHAGLFLVGWIANDIVAPKNRHQEYLSTLRQMLSIPFLGEIPWLTTEKQAEKYLDHDALFSTIFN